jgi:vancomycin resistance protein YoaR
MARMDSGKDGIGSGPGGSQPTDEQGGTDSRGTDGTEAESETDAAAEPPADNTTGPDGTEAENATDADPTPPARRRPRRLALAVGAVVVLLAAGYAAAVAVVSGDVPRGTVVRGVPIGGMTAEQAVATLEQELGDDAGAPLAVTAGEASTELKPADSGLSVDWRATVDQASGLIVNPADLWAHVTGDVEVEPITAIDEEALTQSLADLGEVARQEPREPRIRFNDQAEPKLRKGVPGKELDIEQAATAVGAAYFQQPATAVDLPMDDVAPTVPDAEAQRVFADLAEPAVALPVTLTVGSTSVQVQPADIAATLGFEPEGDTLVAAFDEEGLHERLADDLAGVEQPGSDAAIVIRDGKPTIIKSKKGLSVPDDALGDGVFKVLAETEAAGRTVAVELERTDPDFTTAEARALNIKEKLSSFRQYFPPAPYRYVNVGRAADYLDGTILKPGETFSMNDTIRERTPANGYTEGFIISGGRFREELGGGVSIITTATWTPGSSVWSSRPTACTSTGTRPAWRPPSRGATST